MRLRLTRSMLGNAATLVALAALGWWLLSLQGKPWPAVTPLSQPRIAAAMAMLVYLGFCGWMLWRGRQRRDDRFMGAVAEMFKQQAEISCRQGGLFDRGDDRP